MLCILFLCCFLHRRAYPDSFGCWLSRIFRRDNIDQLRKIASVLGTTDLLEYCEKCSVKLTPELQKAIGNNPVRRPWPSLASRDCPNSSREGLDLLEKLLVYDHTCRLTAAEAMMHPFFDDVRSEIIGGS